MARLRNLNSGAVVNVADDRVSRLGAEWVDVEPDTGTGSGYESQKVDDLKAEIDSRNEGRDEADRIVPDGAKKADLIASLEADDDK